MQKETRDIFLIVDGPCVVLGDYSQQQGALERVLNSIRISLGHILTVTSTSISTELGIEKRQTLLVDLHQRHSENSPPPVLKGIASHFLVLDSHCPFITD